MNNLKHLADQIHGLDEVGGCELMEVEAQWLQQATDEMRQAADRIEQLERLRNPWISVEDELPECGDECLVCFGDSDIRPEIDHMDIEVEYGDFYWVNFDGEVTHWMPLPNAPKEQSK